MRYKRFCASLCALLAAINCFPVFAAEEESAQNQILESGGNGLTQVDLTVTENPLASIFSATIPAVIPAAVDSSGIVTVPDNIAIRNNNAFKGIQVTEIAIEPADTWELANFDSGDFSEMNGKQLSLSLRGDVASDESQKIGLSTDNWNIGASDSLNIPMELKISPQNRIGSLGNIASIVFTLDWWDGTTTSVSEKIQWNLDGEVHTKQLYATFPSDVQGETVSWSSSNSSVASVDQTGLVSIGTVAGKTVISASCGGYQKEIAEISTISSTAQEFTITSENRAAIGYTDETTDLVIPETFVGDGKNGTVKGRTYNVTTIAQFAFSSCKKLSSVQIPESISAIGNNAFYFCENLTSIKIPNSVTFIGEQAFYGCKKLITVTIPNGITAISSALFCQSGLKTIVIPNNIKSIGNSAFSNCTDLSYIDIPSSVTTINYGAFMSSGLTSITIPSNVQTISSNVFWGCDKLKTININRSKDSVVGAPWGATNATVNWLS